MTAYFVTGRWFRAQGVTVKLSQHDAKPIVPVKRQLQLTKAQSGPDRMSSRRLAQQAAIKQPSTLLLCDFDKTIADFDAGEHLLQLGFACYKSQARHGDNARARWQTHATCHMPA